MAIDVGMRKEDGFTLIEMMVVLAMLAGFVGMVTSGLIMGFRTLAENAYRQDATAQSKTAVESMSRTLRTAITPSQLKGTCDTCENAAFITGDSSSVTFYANVDNDAVTQQSGMTNSGPSKVHYALRSGVLTESITRPRLHAASDYNYDWCEHGGTCPVRTRVVANNVQQEGTPLFTYYDRVGATLPVPLEAQVTRLRAVDSVDLTLKIRTSDRVTTATTPMRVTLPNADSLIDPEDLTP